MCEGHVYLEAHILHKPVTILVDTGSSTNLISENLAARLWLKDRMVMSSFKLVGITGAPLQTMGIIKNAIIEVLGFGLTADFLVTSRMNEECILGQKF